MRRYYQLSLGLSAIFIGLLEISSRVRAVIHYVQSATSTTFMHGWGSSSHTGEKMANAARDAGIIDTIVWANVDEGGRITLKHPIPAGTVNPIVEVNFEDNRLSAYRDNYTQDYRRDGEYVKNVVLALEKQHHYKRINFVGHSTGSLEIINYINDNVNDENFPQVAHLVAIAGHCNGLVGQSETQNAKINPKTDELGKMDSAHRELLGLRQTFPKNAVVLNIYGGVGGSSHSDGGVPVNSAKSLKYLVNDRANHIAKLESIGRIPSTISFTITVR